MKKWHTVQDYLVIVFCACLLALSYHLFVFPNEFAPSGLPGIATIIQHVFHFKVGYMTILINVPLVLLTYYIVDHRYAVLSATFAVVFSVVLLALDYVNLAPFEYHTTTGTSTILAPIAGGVISGFCYGMVMRRDSSTGGTDLLAALVHHVRPEMHIIWIVFAINAIVAALSYFVYDFKIEPVILCLIYCFLSSHVGDTMIKGFKEAVKFEIVTDKPEELSAEDVHKPVHRLNVEIRDNAYVCVEEIPAVGGFTHSNKTLLICVVNRHQIVAFQRIIQQFPGSFAYLSSVKETMGNFAHIKR